MKPIKITLEDIFNLPGAVIYNPDSYRSVSSVSIDSRNIKKNSLFIAIKGENFDGHNFISAAVKNGASVVMINKNYLRRIADLEITVITVPDTIKALGDIAKVWRLKLSAKVIGLTGSVGKTTTKEMIATLLSKKYRVSKTISNNNNHIGVPLTILSTNTNHHILVAECGTNHFGEIAYTADILQPDYALITNIGDSHLEFLNDRNGVLKEKSALFAVTSKRKGKLIINADDPLINNFSKKYRNKIKFGFNSGADIKGKILSFDSIDRAKMEIQTKTQKFTVTVPLIGESGAKNFLAAAAVGLEFGLTADDILRASRKIKHYDKRLNIKIFKSFTLLDDTYNANPDSMRASLSVLAAYKNRRRKIAILGDMFELGDKSGKFHVELAEFIKTLQVDEVYTIGNMMNYFFKKLRNHTAVIEHFETRDLLKKYLRKLNLHNSVILVKGSRGMKMEEFVSLIESRVK